MIALPMLIFAAVATRKKRLFRSELPMAASSRTAVLGWNMREGPLLYDVRLGQHMKLGHNPASRTGEAA